MGNAKQALTDEQIDKHIDAVLRAAGSALKHYSMQKSIDDMRSAMRAALLSAQADSQDTGKTWPTIVSDYRALDADWNKLMDALGCVTNDAALKRIAALTATPSAGAGESKDAALERIVQAAHNAVNFVGSANYEHRIREAHKMINAAIAAKGEAK